MLVGKLGSGHEFRGCVRWLFFVYPVDGHLRRPNVDAFVSSALAPLRQEQVEVGHIMSCVTRRLSMISEPSLSGWDATGRRAGSPLKFAQKN